MLDAHALEIVAPAGQFRMRGRDVSQPLLRHSGRHHRAAAIAVELVLQQMIDRHVQAERRPRGPAQLRSHIEPEATRAVQEELDLGTADGLGHVRRGGWGREEL